MLIRMRDKKKLSAAYHNGAVSYKLFSSGVNLYEVGECPKICSNTCTRCVMD